MRVAGIALAFVGVSLQSLGLVLQKKAQNEESCNTTVSNAFAFNAPDEDEDENEDDEDDTESLDLPEVETDIEYLKSKTWRIGFAIFLVGSVLCFVALGWIGPSMLVIVSSFALVMNLILSPIM